LAHVERYNYLHRNGLDYYRNLRERGVNLQVNIGSITGVYSPPVMKMAKELLDNDLVDFLGSDMHNERHAEYLKKGLKNQYLQKVLREKTFKNIDL